VGLSTFIGIWGLGTIIVDSIRLRLPARWKNVTAVLLGIQTLSLSVQLTGIAAMAFPLVLRAMWWGLVCVGAAMLFRDGARDPQRPSQSTTGRLL
jgi:hypothetical protein